MLLPRMSRPDFRPFQRFSLPILKHHLTMTDSYNLGSIPLAHVSELSAAVDALYSIASPFRSYSNLISNLMIIFRNHNKTNSEC